MKSKGQNPMMVRPLAIAAIFFVYYNPFFRAFFLKIVGKGVNCNESPIHVSNSEQIN
jgi:hypothetical protein